MEKAETMMRKMGWEYGRGLGKNEDGPVKAVKLNSQKSRQGFGYSEVDNDFWWVRIYDEAAKNVTSYTVEEEEENEHIDALKVCKRKMSNESDKSILRKNKKKRKTKKLKEYSEVGS